jgi:hypothetical protein
VASCGRIRGMLLHSATLFRYQLRGPAAPRALRVPLSRSQPQLQPKGGGGRKDRVTTERRCLALTAVSACPTTAVFAHHHSLASSVRCF